MPRRAARASKRLVVSLEGTEQMFACDALPVASRRTLNPEVLNLAIAAHRR